MQLDPRLNAYRDDLAASTLRGKVKAKRFVAGTPYNVTAASVPVRRLPATDAPLDSQALFGERVRVYDIANGWAWGQLETDGYVGYLPVDRLSPLTEKYSDPTHRVATLRTYIYKTTNIKAPTVALISMGSLVTVKDEDRAFAVLPNGSALFARHLVPIAHNVPDYVSLACQFVGTPYLWGGRTSLGLDCSGLVFTVLRAAGIAAPRDAYMQEATLGEPVALAGDLTNLRRGDLVFWPGHVGIMKTQRTLVHACGHQMLTVTEPIRRVVKRNDALNLPLRTVRRFREVKSP